METAPNITDVLVVGDGSAKNPLRLPDRRVSRDFLQDLVDRMKLDDSFGLFSEINFRWGSGVYTLHARVNDEREIVVFLSHPRQQIHGSDLSSASVDISSAEAGRNSGEMEDLVLKLIPLLPKNKHQPIKFKIEDAPPYLDESETRLVYS